MPEPSSAPSGTVQPMLINDAAAWSACFGPFLNSTYPLRSFGFVAQATDTVYLQCGPKDSKTFGWHHIQDGHQLSWQTRVDNIPGGGAGIAWDDFMADITSQVLDMTDRYTVEYNGKRCYTSTFLISSTSGQIAYQFNPSVVVSMTNNRVITSYPSTNQDCARRAPWQF